jgi:hypothetical protein
MRLTRIAIAKGSKSLSYGLCTLPADVLGTLSCKTSNFRKRVRKLLNKAKLRGDQRSEVK